LKPVNQYCGIDIIVRKGSGVARVGSKILHKIDSGTDDEIYESLITFVDETFEGQWGGHDDVPSISRSVLKGLRQLPSEFKLIVMDRLNEYQEDWGKDVYVRFGITGILAAGKAGAQPNYQIESGDVNQAVTSHYDHSFYENDENPFKDCNLTERLSLSTLKKAWEFCV